MASKSHNTDRKVKAASSKNKAELEKAGDSESLEKDFFGTKEDHPEDRSVTSRERLRGQVLDQVEQFLAEGGEIAEVKPHVTGDPPKKPGNSYGSRPI